ncbi:dnaJ domain protein [Neorickettsia helminthoeca str. Oregon]|uniref:DnaJ domain protein n=1 Tax=Neorickettsia helminthoeca str. Oregon TaxID=1286528 RepID=X5HLH1_9RICK|nr:hypothetical protein [Neorickettsia helminthoeca]AHX11240.1 dnaJ domain protein [Neorickettsia helminthoeca str. Oregon]
MENRKENYFEILGLKQRFKLSPGELENEYLRLQKKLREDDQSDNKISQINKAYFFLKDPVNRAQHLLELGGFRSFTNGAPMELLSKIIELEEKLAEKESPETVTAVEEMYKVHLELMETAFEKEEYGIADSHRVALKYITKLRNRIHATHNS